MDPNDQTVAAVDPNTDNIDDFALLFKGTAQQKVETDDTVKVAEEDQLDKVETDNEDDVDLEETSTEDEDSANEKDLDDEDPTEEEETEPEEKPTKKVNKVQERINQVLARERIANERAAELQRKLDEAVSRQTENTTVVKNDEPAWDDKLEDGSDKYPLGEFDPQYIRDLARHTIQTETAAIKEQEAKERTARQEQEARAELQEQWVEKLTPVTEQHEDFLEKTLELESTFEGLDARYSDYLVQTIKSLEHGPEVLYYFANNLPEAQKFVRMGPLAATLALGEINAMFKGNTRKEPPKVSKAPPPPQVTTKGTTQRKTVRADTDDFSAFSQTFFASKKK